MVARAGQLKIKEKRERRLTAGALLRTMCCATQRSFPERERRLIEPERVEDRQFLWDKGYALSRPPVPYSNKETLGARIPQP